MTLPIPIQLLFEAKGMKVSVELINNELYNGILKQVDYNLNVELADAILLNKDKTKKITNVLIRGSQIKFVKVPDSLQYSPLFEQKQKAKDITLKQTKPQNQ